MESPRFDRARELKAFDDTKAGVKGLVDAGIKKVPQIFHLPKDDTFNPPKKFDFNIPIIDLNLDVGKDSRLWRETVEKVRRASEEEGFFQVVNHGIPIEVLNEMLNGVRKFNEQDVEVKKQYYTRDSTKKFMFNSNFDLYSAPAAKWRDTFFCWMAPNPPEPQDLPDLIRDIQIEYSRHVMKLAHHLFGLLSEALGLESTHLIDMECGKGLMFLAHYYPACPQPELTLGATKHTDGGFITVLLPDQIIGGLQYLVENQWADVPPVPAALLINIGDFLQIISNGKFKSMEHRVLANQEGPRVSVACVFTTSIIDSSKTYGPIKELVSEHDPAKYREVTFKEFAAYKYSKGLDKVSPFLHFKK